MEHECEKSPARYIKYAIDCHKRSWYKKENHMMVYDLLRCMATENGNIKITTPQIIRHSYEYANIVLTPRKVRTILKNLKEDGVIMVKTIDNVPISQRRLLIHICTFDELRDFEFDDEWEEHTILSFFKKIIHK